MGPAGEGADGRRGGRRRLSRSAEFDRVFRQGRSRAGRHLVLHSFPRAGADPGEGPRLGVSVGRRVGGAVERNRVKRLVRESFWSLAPELPEGTDFVVVARPDAAELAHTRGRAGFDEALRDLLPGTRVEAPPADEGEG
jgi:ribonuclease P protein component